MKPGDIYVHRESGARVVIVRTDREDVYYRRPGTKPLWVTPLWNFLENYRPAPDR